MSGFSAADHAHMARALRLAEAGLYTTQPNPRVGCVIAHDEEIVGEGFHARAGEPHAEVFALRAAGKRAQGASVYVTLEPCAHFGRTPPCVDALIAAGVARVVASCEDPNPKVAGGGFAKLRAAGITVEPGLMREAARELNRGFFSRLERHRPWVRVKLGMSLDGRTALANGKSKWITGEAARVDVQRWRARSSAILTGSGTVLSDDPHLTVRLDEPFAPPARIVLDSRLRIPLAANVLDGRVETIVMHAPETFSDRFHPLFERLAVDAVDGQLVLSGVLEEIARRGVNELQVEAGPTLCGALFAAGFVDELLLYVAPILLGSSARPLLVLPEIAEIAARQRLRVIDERRIGEDWRLLLRE